MEILISKSLELLELSDCLAELLRPELSLAL
jgi:hypothetical protein